MNPNLLKTGSCSIVLGPGYYERILPIKKDKLVKVTEIRTKHNEFKYLSMVKNIPNFSSYYSIPDEIAYLLNPSNKFYADLKKIVEEDGLSIFNGPLQCYYMDWGGDKDILDTINDMVDFNDFSLWRSYKTILEFSNKIMKGLEFLHNKKMCHLDIKPENIVVDTIKCDFKIIDFGFCSVEPFSDYLSDIRGTRSYFPKHYKNDTIYPWFPKIEANDVEITDGLVPMQRNIKLVYKIDSYCFGRVLLILKYFYKENRTYCCFSNEMCSEKKLDKIIASLVENDVNKRLTIKECLDRHFNKTCFVTEV